MESSSVHRSDAAGADAARTTVLYDRDCGFCCWSLAGLLSLDRRRRLRPVPLQAPEAERLLPGLDFERRLASAHVVTPEGRVHSGGDAVAPLLRLLPGGAPLAPVASRVPGLPRVVYDFVAGRRGAIGSRLPRRWVERATARIDAHG